MIEASAVILGPCDIHDSAYIGHFCVIGTPVLRRGFGEAKWEITNSDDHWADSRGVTVGRGVTISTHVVVDDGTNIGLRVYIDSGVKIGHDVEIANDAELYYRCEISSRASIGAGAWIGGFVCNDASIGDGAVMFGSLIHRFTDATRGIPEDPPQVQEGAFVGFGATVIGGVTVGREAYLGAGSVLTSNAQSGRLYLGSPAVDCGRAPQPFSSHEGRTSPPLGGGQQSKD